MKLNFYKLTLLIFLCFNMISFGQQENANWYFGNGAGLNFNGAATPIFDGQTTNLHYQSATVSDDDGNLLFYTDGSTVWNGNHQVIGSGLNGGSRTVSIVPMPGDCNKYYVFTILIDHPTIGDDYFYSIVDIENNTITNLNTNLNLLPIAEKDEIRRENHMTVATHADGESYWLILNPFDELLSILITSNGISNTPVITPEDQFSEYHFGFKGTSGISISPNMQRIAYAKVLIDNDPPPYGFTRVNRAYVFTFDNLTGTFTYEKGNSSYVNPSNPNPSPYEPFQAFEFSQNSQVLYSILADETNNSYNIGQMNLQTSSPYLSGIILNSFQGGNGLSNSPTLVRGIDNKIYVPKSGTKLDVINSPNTLGLGCNYQSNQIDLGRVTRKLPQQVQIQNNTNNCDTDPCEGTSITIENKIPNCESLEEFWYFNLNTKIITPAGYDLNQANADYYSNNFSLDIIDLDNNQIFATLPTSAIDSGLFQNGILYINYVIDWQIMANANNSGNYAFRINANLTTSNGICELSYTAYKLSFDACEAPNPCDENPIQVSSEIPKCDDLDLINGFSFEICGTYCYDDVTGPYLFNMELDIIDIDNNNQVIYSLPGNPSIINGNFCFEILDSYFINGLVGNYNFRITTSYQDFNGNMYEVLKTIEGISFEPCPIECNEIKEVKLEEDGLLLTWDPEEQAEQYTILFTENPKCDIDYDPSENGVNTHVTSYNYFDLKNLIGKYKECLSFKIISNCGSETPWCTLKWVDDHFEFLNGSCSALSRKSQDNINVFPNPATNKLSVSSENSKIAVIEIYNIHGKPIQIHNSVNSLSQQIDVNRLPRGYYIMKVTLENGTSQHKNILLK